MGTGLRISDEPTGVVVEGNPVRRWSFGHQDGLLAEVLSYGATLQALWVPGEGDQRTNIVLGFREVQQYMGGSARPAGRSGPGPYFGATVGRYANRIAGGRFRLDGREYEVPVNDRGNALHGGTAGFNTRMWLGEEVRDQEGWIGVRLRYLSPDGEMGFPGNLQATVSYLTDGRKLRIDYWATSDAPTVVNMTNHSYFNLKGEAAGNIKDHVLSIDADEYLPLDKTGIPIGPALGVAGTPFDFLDPHPIGERLGWDDPQLVGAGGYDHNWVLAGAAESSELRRAATLWEPQGGRSMEVWTDQPGLQFYAGNSLDGTLTGYSGQPYRRNAGLALETQHFPDSPNREDYPSTVLRRGEEYHSTTVYLVSTGISGD